jgi:hypothetical protein
MGVLQTLQHVKFVIDHSFVPFNILLQNDLDSHLANGRVGLPYDAIRAGAQGSSESIFGPDM